MHPERGPALKAEQRLFSSAPPTEGRTKGQRSAGGPVTTPNALPRDRLSRIFMEKWPSLGRARTLSLDAFIMRMPSGRPISIIAADHFDLFSHPRLYMYSDERHFLRPGAATPVQYSFKVAEAYVPFDAFEHRNQTSN